MSAIIKTPKKRQKQQAISAVVKVPNPLPATYRNFIPAWKTFIRSVDGCRVMLRATYKMKETFGSERTIAGWRVRSGAQSSGATEWIPTAWLILIDARQGTLFGATSFVQGDDTYAYESR